jgi:hypothetical protein
MDHNPGSPQCDGNGLTFKTLNGFAVKFKRHHSALLGGAKYWMLFYTHNLTPF